MIFLRLAIKELLNHRRLSFLFVFNLSLGLLALILVDSLRVSVSRHIDGNSQEMAGADIVFTQYNERMAPKGMETMNRLVGAESRMASSIQLLSMVTVKGDKTGSRLCEIFFQGPSHPLYGEILLRDFSTGRIFSHSNAQSRFGGENYCWVAPSVASALDLTRGNRIQIGNAIFIVDHLVEKDPGRNAAVGAALPRVYLDLRHFETCGLESKGSQIRYNSYYRLPDGGVNAEAVVERLREEVAAAFPEEEGFRIRSHREYGQQLGRVMRYVSDYLALGSLAALFLSGIGAAYLFRSFITAKGREVAILMALGASRNVGVFIASIQIILMGAASALLAQIASMVFLPLFPYILKGLLPDGFQVIPSGKSAGLGLVVGTVGALFFCLSFLLRIAGIPPAKLFHDIPPLSGERRLTKVWFFLSFLPLLAGFYGMSLWLSLSFKIGTFFFLFFFSALILSAFSGFLSLGLVRFLAARGGFILSLAWNNLYRNRTAALSGFLAIAMGTMLTSLVPQMKRSIASKLGEQEDKNLPSLFLFDIQEEQVDPLEEYAVSNRLALSHLSPWIRARMAKINGELVRPPKWSPRQSRRREFAREFKDMVINLTYREGLFSSERIVRGRPIRPVYSSTEGGIAEISLDEDFAKNMGIKVGDVVEFGIHDIPIEGRVVNLRRVDWMSFQPNFFISFQVGVLEDAPKTYLANIPDLTGERKRMIQNELADIFPNISAVDVSDVSSRIVSIVDQLASAIQMMSFFAIAAGIMVVFSIAVHEMYMRSREINLLKTLGGGFATLNLLVLAEFGGLGSLAAAVGGVFSMILNWLFSRTLLYGAWTFSLDIPSGVWVAVTGLCMAVAWIATRRILLQRPLILLKEGI